MELQEWRQKAKQQAREQLLSQNPMGFVEENGWKRYKDIGDLPGKYIVYPLCGFRGKVDGNERQLIILYPAVSGGIFWLALQVQQVKELQEGIENLGDFSPS